MIPGLGNALPNISASASSSAQGGNVGGSSFTFGGIQTGGSNIPPYALLVAVGVIAVVGYMLMRRR